MEHSNQKETNTNQTNSSQINTNDLTELERNSSLIESIEIDDKNNDEGTLKVLLPEEHQKEEDDQRNHKGKKKKTTEPNGVNKRCLLRLKKEYLKLLKDDSLHQISAHPLESNLLEWHFVIHSIKDKKSPYFGGYYHGKLIFKETYPFSAPSITLLTPNGRFKTNTKICLSMTDFHQESWNPNWSVSTILKGLLSFMLEETSTYGSVKCSFSERRRYARESVVFNQKNEIFKDLFCDLHEESIKSKQPEEIENNDMHLEEENNSNDDGDIETDENLNRTSKSSTELNTPSFLQNHPRIRTLYNTILFIFVSSIVVYSSL